ncbi:hypothetical protein C469_02985 [Halorubrum lipolyticum DSM 21995]|uniref:Uncharacterized protein n=1 Tax=Halorubrum lipolyticum DSM 21995 TaxID=1227482 RepID=M0P190_9EURY|nr:hypothetical protein C469_02985 [Halorubrum lipolyticum DSM 21995]
MSEYWCVFSQLFQGFSAVFILLFALLDKLFSVHDTVFKTHDIVSIISFCKISLHRELFDRLEPEFAIFLHLIDMAIVDILPGFDLDEQ